MEGKKEGGIMGEEIVDREGGTRGLPTNILDNGPISHSDVKLVHGHNALTD